MLFLIDPSHKVVCNLGFGIGITLSRSFIGLAIWKFSKLCCIIGFLKEVLYFKTQNVTTISWTHVTVMIKCKRGIYGKLLAWASLFSRNGVEKCLHTLPHVEWHRWNTTAKTSVTQCSVFAHNIAQKKNGVFYCYALKMITVVIETFARCQLLCTEDDNSCYRNVCKMSVVSFALAVVFIITEFFIH